MKPQIVNIINFIRGVEPRDPETNLPEPVEKQLELLEEYGFQGTFLIQYDAMMNPSFTEVLKRPSNMKHEIGAWLEVVRPLVEKAGLAWRGRPGFDWDWHADVGFTVGYTPDEREKLCDVFMEDFRDTFGFYPKSVGSWIIDAHTLAYLEHKYSITASCNCKDQWGTDGYTLWGGYYNQAYYPGRKNVFCPAQTLENQINVPVFRMLGSDPIYQYDAGMAVSDGFSASACQPVITLEPVYPEGGGSEEWVKWYLKENFNGLCLSFGYTQVGQENSFSWPLMEKGLLMQFKQISEYVAEGRLKVETLADSADWFRKSYPMTPASAVAALSDWKTEGHKSIWFSNRNYRLNLYQEAGKLWIRDMHIFDENYEERYLGGKCKENSLCFDNLPVMDGNRWSHGNIRAGIYPVVFDENGNKAFPEVLEPAITDLGDGRLEAVWRMAAGGQFKVLCGEASVEISCTGNDASWGLEFLWSWDVKAPVAGFGKGKLHYLFNTMNYALYFEAVDIKGSVKDGRVVAHALEKKISLHIKQFYVESTMNIHENR
jgi:hypothetical protein